MIPRAIVSLCVLALLCACGSPHPKTSLDPLGLGMDTYEYMAWVMALPDGPPLKAP